MTSLGKPQVHAKFEVAGFTYGWDVINRYWSKSAIFSESGSLWAQIIVGRDVASNNCWYHKTWVFLLSHSENRVILRSFIWYQRVTDGRTDGIAVANTALCIASNAATL